MLLRSGGVRKQLFGTKGGTVTPFPTPTTSVKEQKDQKVREQANAKMAEEIVAYSKCCETAGGKIQRIRAAVENAAYDHSKFNIHALRLYLKTIDSAYEEYNVYQNKIYLADPKRKEEFEVKFVVFEELYEFTRIAICQMIEDHDNEKKVLELTTERTSVTTVPALNDNQASGSGINRVMSVPPTIMLHQSALPNFDGRYENWFKFKQMFCDIADKCVGDSPATKLHYLDKALVGRAQGSIDPQIIRDNDYDGAWRSLTQQFENLPALIGDTINKLLTLKNITAESFHQLKLLVDDVEKCVSSLEFHDLKMDKLSEAIVTTLVSSKLDADTRKVWESHVKRGQLPAYKQMVAVLRNQQHILERCENAKSVQKTRGPFPASRAITGNKAHTVTINKVNDSCPICEEKHVVEKCDAFKRFGVKERYEKAKQAGLCFGCLKKGHRTSNCYAKVKCLKCSRQHNVLLHPEDKSDSTEKKVSEKPTVPVIPENPMESSSSQVVAKNVIPCQQEKQVLLATAVLNVFDEYGNQHKCRVLLDSGAMANFISQRVADYLQLCKQYVNVPIIGVNGMRTTVKFQVSVKAKSRISHDEFSLEYLVVPRITGFLPAKKVDITGWPIPEGLHMADPKFFEPSRIDMLIGAEAFYDLLLSGSVKMTAELPVLQESILGWLVSGRISGSATVTTVQACPTMTSRESDVDLVNILKQFWSIDDQTSSPAIFNDDCERHFLETVQRTTEGRYIVRLPFRGEHSDLGRSRQHAETRFYQLEQRLDKNPELKKAYADFITEYLNLGHGRIYDESDNSTEASYYLPHHCVLRPDNSTTKLRVVFDASAKSETGKSLNDLLMVGPPVQDTLFEILLRFRLHKYAFTADVPKMYRQIKMHEDDIKFQRILWRDCRSKPLQVIELTTVTYGTAAAPFLATRVLKQLAEDEIESYAKASEVVLKSFYVDDVLAGADTIAEAKQLQEDLVAMLSKGGFELHKWCANNPALLENIPCEKQEKLIDFQNCHNTVKTLGLLWSPINDDFTFRVKPLERIHDSWTKRQVLSEIGKLFDPLGVLGPVIILAKIIIQELWKNNLQWDDTLPIQLMTSWKKLRMEFSDITSVNIPRRVTVDGTVSREIHGFADASLKAYGCCIYLRNVRADESAELFLLCGKSRVTPIKELEPKSKNQGDFLQITMPRLELCAARLLAEQTSKVMKALGIEINRVTLWSDSQIVLGWLQHLKSDASVFVVNRVSQIRELTDTYEWKYVNTKDNPADLISRGVYPKQLAKADLWWKGPCFLRDPKLRSVVLLCAPVAKQLHSTEQNEQVENRSFNRNSVLTAILNCSNYRKLERVFGYVMRFIENCQAKVDQRRHGKLNRIDFNAAVEAMVRAIQREVFKEEIKCIDNGKPLKGKLNNLNPFLEKNKRLLRVGGRLRHSNLPYNHRHPLILPEKHHFTEILIAAMHRENLHVGQNGLLAALRCKFWPIQAKRSINRVLRRCVTCFRVKPKDTSQFMGDLPMSRVTVAEPFARTGVDYAGPIILKQGRGKAHIKGYIAIFVCMCIKAIHLELVTSMSADAFLAALHRFTGRRGNICELWSDNGTNFIGASRLLAELRELLRSQILEKKVSEFCQVRGVTWNFNPPKAPHQGGLWEAGVKSAKYHLYRALNQSYLSYEEMNTLLIQIEAVLNSRPLCQQSGDPLDYRALSPAHFLIGRELTAVAEPLYEGIKENTLSRYQLIQKRKQDFYRRWSKEYLSELQQRSKWTKKPAAIQKDMLVLLKEENIPPQHWSLGRIIDTYPGKDGISRVVTVRTAAGEYRRPTTQIAILPIPDNNIEM